MTSGFDRKLKINNTFQISKSTSAVFVITFLHIAHILPMLSKHTFSCLSVCGQFGFGMPILQSTCMAIKCEVGQSQSNDDDSRTVLR